MAKPTEMMPLSVLIVDAKPSTSRGKVSGRVESGSGCVVTMHRDQPMFSLQTVQTSKASKQAPAD